MRNSFLSLVVVLLSMSDTAAAIEKPGQDLPEVRLSTVLGRTINLTTELTDSNGERFTLKDVASSNKPIVLIPVYYQCPRLCGLLLNGVTKLLNELDLELGQDFEVLTVSFDHTESFKLAAKRAQHYRAKLLNTPENKRSAWRFAVGSQDSVSSLMQTIGFSYKKDRDEFVHSAAFILLTPQGEISQYFTGIDFPAWDVRLALVDASKGSIGTMIDHVYLYCFRFDSLKGKYTWAAFGLFKVGGVLTLLGLGWLYFHLLRRGGREK